MYPISLLFNSIGNTVTGIDIDYVGYNEPYHMKLWNQLSKNGLLMFLRTIQLKILGKEKEYYRALQKYCNFSLNDENIAIRQMNVEHMDFPDNTFDIVVSKTVFEHISDIPKAVSEIHRIMTKGGITCHVVHLFTSLSGGHNSYYFNPKRVPPWGHLRLVENQIPSTFYLNKIRMHEYISMFQQKFKILQVLKIEDPIARSYLTPEIRATLLDYSEEELVAKLLVIMAKKEWRLCDRNYTLYGCLLSLMNASVRQWFLGLPNLRISIIHTITALILWSISLTQIQLPGADPMTDNKGNLVEVTWAETRKQEELIKTRLSILHTSFALGYIEN